MTMITMMTMTMMMMMMTMMIVMIFNTVLTSKIKFARDKSNTIYVRARTRLHVKSLFERFGASSRAI